MNSAIQTAQQMKQASEQTDDGCMKALAAVIVLLGGNNAATAVAMTPIDGPNGLGKLISNSEVRAQLGDSVVRRTVRL
ncbi:hypothetical protein ACTACG_21515 [Pseudomonas syringae]|uniref:hypothetical protein n=1 Tax=Pseudomonas syringae TaxID=317 RepID=UPI003F756FBB